MSTALQGNVSQARRMTSCYSPPLLFLGPPAAPPPIHFDRSVPTVHRAVVAEEQLFLFLTPPQSHGFYSQLSEAKRHYFARRFDSLPPGLP